MRKQPIPIQVDTLRESWYHEPVAGGIIGVLDVVAGGGFGLLISLRAAHRYLRNRQLLFYIFSGNWVRYRHRFSAFALCSKRHLPRPLRHRRFLCRWFLLPCRSFTFQINPSPKATPLLSIRSVFLSCSPPGAPGRTATDGAGGLPGQGRAGRGNRFPGRPAA